MSIMSTTRQLCAAVIVALAVTGVQAQTVVRHPVADFPIAKAVEVPAGYSTVYLSGTVPTPVAEQRFGSTRQQTASVLAAIQTTLSGMDLDMGDIVKMQVFLVGDPAHNGKMDFAGFMDAYSEFFGTARQPNLPARSVMQVAGLVNPEWLVEIEVTAVRKP